MDSIVEVVGLEPILLEAGCRYSDRNFEELYSNLHSAGELETLRLIEDRIRQYFSSLELPDQPTLYDHLVLSLRKKDLIATFNWDPFLSLALKRNRLRAIMPRAAFLHGNVSIGYCENHRQMGPRDSRCPKCHVYYTDSELLYPVSQKDYTKYPFLKVQWDALQRCLQSAYVLTVFGYSAPTSDIEACRLMKEAWGPALSRSYEETEFIDIQSEEQLRATWSDFIHTHHSSTHQSFYDSHIAKHPRRTCEATWASTMENESLDDRDIPRNAEWDELTQWYKPLVSAELVAEANKQGS